ncbi:MAG TPA: putative O-glycosylation ligase, exosortase A system-associated [Dongiaceae bacterium]|nr:putative O-glycosylation ligase, exosortase A system-associated [Dongiaceae bacterium]
MRDFIIIVIILGSVPVCLLEPYCGVLMWYWVTYFNPHRFGWSFAYDFPVAAVVAVPTLAGTVFARKSLSSLLVRESILLLLLWVWFAFTYLHATGIPLFTGNMADAGYEMSHVSKIFLFTVVMIILVTTKDRLRWLILVTAGSLGLLAVKGALFGLRTSGESRVWGPPDSFLADNNAFGLALNMCLPLLFFLIRQENRRWMRIALRITFLCTILVILLTYSRGALLGLGVVLAALLFRTKHKLVGGFMMVVAAFFVITFAPTAWMSRMSRFLNGDLDASAEQRLVSWGTAWNLSHDYPLTGGSFDALPNVQVFQKYEPRPLPLGFLSSGPHSIYFQLLADQGFVGLGIFLLLILSCFWSLWRIRRLAARFSNAAYLVDYSHMIEISILGFMVSGAFLGFVYLDVIYQMIGITVILKVLLRQELLAREEIPSLNAVVMEAPIESPVAS